MDQKRKKTINKFAILIILLILVPEIVGHSLFDKPHPASSSVNAAVALTDKINKGFPDPKFSCHLEIQNDSTSVNVTRAAGMQGEYAKYACGSS